MNLIKLEREWVGKYIHHRNLLNKGRGELSWLTEILKIFGLAGGIAFSTEIKKNWQWLALAAVAYVLLSYFIGWWWDKRHHFDLESEWGNARNPLTDDIRKAIK